MSTNIEQIKSLLLSLLPKDGSTVGNLSLKEQLRTQHQLKISDEEFDAARQSLLTEGVVGKGRGRGGATYLNQPNAAEQPAPAGFELQAQVAPSQEDLTFGEKQKPARPQTNRQPGKKRGEHNQVLSYRYDEKRKNNPHVGMVDTHSDGVEQKTTWQYDPHLSPELQFDPARSRVEDLIEDALQAREVEAKQAKDDLLSWLDHALAADNEQAVREVVSNLRKRVADKEFLDRERDDLAELKRMQAPYLNWTGKAERTSFEVDTVSLHVHERIDPATILAAVQKRVKDSKGKSSPALQPDLFHAPFENLPLRDAIDFYKHERDWANRMIAGDSLLVMNSLLQKESMAGQVQMIYVDPPYGIKYGSNFQPFVHKKDVADRKDEDLTQEPEMIKAFRDTWELGVHSYLSYLRDRLLLSRELLAESGSIFVQISDENLHHVRELLDEVFGEKNFVAQIAYVTTSSQGSGLIPVVNDYVVWYSKNISEAKYRALYEVKEFGSTGSSGYSYIETDNGKKSRISKCSDKELEEGKAFAASDLTSSHYSISEPISFQESIFSSNARYWSTSTQGMYRLSKAGRILESGNNIRYKRYFDDFCAFPRTNVWTDTGVAGFTSSRKMYVVQTNEKVIERCVLMTTDPGDLVFDPTCGSGTTAYVSEKLGRRWVTCDTSRISITLAKQRLMTSGFDYFELKYPNEGLKGGFIYKSVPRITLKSIANNPEITDIYDEYHPDIVEALEGLNSKLHDADESLPWFEVLEGARKGIALDFSPGNDNQDTLPTGEELPNNSLLEWEVPLELPQEWIPEEERLFDERNQQGQSRDLSGIEYWFDKFHEARMAMQRRMDASIANHAGQEVLYDQPEVSRDKVRITGPFTVEAVPFATVLGLDEAEQPKEADVAVARSGATSRQGQWQEELLKAGIRGKGGQQIKLQDLETLPGAHYIHAVGTVAESGDRVAVSFGPEHAALEQRQVEIAMREAGDLFPLPKMLVFCAFNFDPEAAKDIDNIKGVQALKVHMNTDLLTEDLKKGRASNQSFWLMGQPDVEVHELKGGKLQVEVHGFDYFDTKTGELKSGGKKNIAMWQLDTDYDNRSLYARQVFFPMAGKKDGWYRLKKDIRAELNEDLMDKFHGTKSIPFEPGDNRCIAVKIVDDRGIESLKVIRLN
ncbi:site-specific DNA-methyltransferase [Marinobacter sp. AC-23]|uniref:site-specific DNA-methyltransferase n=1 Tax=Marinobacter sp. AC-23 TaxID=1879031 RepID=UPI0008DDA4A2|nr:site-specific DNA-methyltransferase [Marinobacter sp. AC-23]OHY82027.1 DNA methylase [Marinobacter sp. AC-23]